MKTIETSTIIDATPDDVWRVLADLASYPEWNPFIIEGSGELRQGEKLALRIKPPGGRAMKFRPQLLAVEPGQELRWVGRLLFKGLFDGEHWFSLEPEGAGTRLIQGERFSGILSGFTGSMLKRTEDGFEQMNAALKSRVEGK